MSWYYNWGPIPMDCDRPFAREFVPMIWTCMDGNCTHHLPPDFRKKWKDAGVRFLQGFNEPSMPAQASLTPLEAAIYWWQIDNLAQSFNPPLRLVGPSMVSWNAEGGSDWLDEFFALLDPKLKARIEFLGQHDYSGNVNQIKRRSEAAYAKYGRRVWLNEFAVGRLALKGEEKASRTQQNNFLKEALPMLDSTFAIYRYAWYSTRNGDYRRAVNGAWNQSETAYVTRSSLLKAADEDKDRWEWEMRPTSTGSIYRPRTNA
jgi:hypothetical protein